MVSTGGGVDVRSCLWICLSRKGISETRTRESLGKNRDRDGWIKLG